jgi:CDP-diacylglycerol--serine O-phosphatidyltransferase
LVTIVNAALGFLAIALLARYWAANPGQLRNGVQLHELKLGGALIGLGALCDVADGIVARLTWSSRLGDHLDGMADAITFGVAPALLVAVAGLGHSSLLSTLFLAAATTHVVAVVVRLARHASAPHASADGFVGVTSPMGAVAVIGVLALQLAPGLTFAGLNAASALILGGFHYPHQTRPGVMVLVVAFTGLAIAVVTGAVAFRVAGALGLATIIGIPVVAHVSASFAGRPARLGAAGDETVARSSTP